MLPNYASQAATRAEEFPDTRVRHRSPPDVPPELLRGLRLGAARLFKVGSSLPSAHCPRQGGSWMLRLPASGDVHRERDV